MRKLIECSIRISAAAVLVAWIALSGAGGRMAWASPSDSADDETADADEPAASNSVEAAIPQPAPAPPAPMPERAAAPVGTLVGTAVVEGGLSCAVLQGANGLRLVREGGEIVSGTRLLLVKRGLIVVESQGIQQEIHLASTGSAAVRGEEANAPPQELTGEVERLLGLRAQKFQASMELRSRQLK
jgi:hypothetical protein